MAPSALESSTYEEERIRRARDCTQEGVRAGLKSAAIAGIVTAPPVLIGGRRIPWMKRNLNYTAQALLICGASIAAYFIVSDKTILECAREGSYNAIKAQREASAEH